MATSSTIPANVRPAGRRPKLDQLVSRSGSAYAVDATKTALVFLEKLMDGAPIPFVKGAAGAALEVINILEVLSLTSNALVFHTLIDYS